MTDYLARITQLMAEAEEAEPRRRHWGRVWCEIAPDMFMQAQDIIARLRYMEDHPELVEGDQ